MSKTPLCVNCNQRPITNIKRCLCSICYQKLRREGKIDRSRDFYTKRTLVYIQHKAEVDFIKNYFNHSNFIYQPANFHLDNGTSYTPDFYDQQRQVFIEVAGTKQAYHINKDKYKKLIELYPSVTLEIRKSNGELLNIDKPNWEG